MQPFLVLPAHVRRPAARACGILGLEESERLLAYVSLNKLLVFFGARNSRPVVVHLAVSPLGEHALERHRRGLNIVGSLVLPRSVGDLVPALVQSRDQAGCKLLVQSRCPGSSDQPEIPFDTKLEMALQPLLALRATAEHCQEGPDHHLLFESFPRLLGRWPELDGGLSVLLLALQSWQQQRRLPGILTHGDCWVRNILFEGGKSAARVSGIVDWESARRHGTPGFDAMHLALMSLAMESGRGIVTYLQQAWEWQWENAFLRDWIEKLQIAYGLVPDDVQCLAGVIYLNELHKLASNDRQLLKERRLMVTVMPTIEAWLARRDTSPALMHSAAASPARQAGKKFAWRAARPGSRRPQAS